MHQTPRPPLISPEVLLKAYTCGIFPMSESADDETLFWVEPEARGIIPLDRFTPSRSLRKTIRRAAFEVSVDRDFEAVIAACAEPGEGRESTWISHRIRDLYGQLFALGFCHTVECRQDGRLVGGLYGLAIGGAFFGESMFSRASDASKVALTYLVARLKVGGFALLDTQFTTEHLLSMGAVEISRNAYRERLAEALDVANADFYCWPGAGTSDSVLHATSQMS